MHRQLGLLLEIQDLKMQRNGLADGSLADLESGVFDIEIADAIKSLEEKVEQLEGRLDRRIVARYRRIARTASRVVVPVINGICYGCFVAVARASAVEADRNSRVETCEQCGCFLYHVD